MNSSHQVGVSVVVNCGLSLIPDAMQNAKCHICHQHTQMCDVAGTWCTTCGIDIETTTLGMLEQTFSAMGYPIEDVSLMTGTDPMLIQSYLDGDRVAPESFIEVYLQVVREHYNRA